jgi:hypothetical protein
MKKCILAQWLVQRPQKPEVVGSTLSSDKLFFSEISGSTAEQDGLFILRQLE